MIARWLNTLCTYNWPVRTISRFTEKSNQMIRTYMLGDNIIRTIETRSQVCKFKLIGRLVSRQLRDTKCTKLT